MAEQKRNRIIFIDLMRALAVFMMVQGHTVDTFLAPEYKTGSITFEIWNYLRGFTAPIFMFSAGVAFTYLFKLNGEKFKANPRTKKGIVRFFSLIVIAYLLRYPTYKIFDFSEVTNAQWAAFFVVDTLHLIAFGLLFIMFFLYVSEKLKIPDIKLFILGTALFLALQIICEPINWPAYVNPFIGGYLYSGSGSLFPLFPWAGYLLCGAALGSKIAENPSKVREPKFGIRLIVIALMVFAFGKTLEQIKFALNWGEPFWVNAIYLYTLRLSFVISLNGAISLFAYKLNNIPKVIKLFGRYSLLIYIVHIIALYGDTWFPGMNYLYYQKFDILATLAAVVVMLSLMGVMVLGLDYFKNRNKKNIKVVENSNLNVELVEK